MKVVRRASMVSSLPVVSSQGELLALQLMLCRNGCAPKSRVVAATVDSRTYGRRSHKISMCPDIASCLIVSVAAVCDEMDQKN
jgi:hypothetical protein